MKTILCILLLTVPSLASANDIWGGEFFEQMEHFRHQKIQEAGGNYDTPPYRSNKVKVEIVEVPSTRTSRQATSGLPAALPLTTLVQQYIEMRLLEPPSPKK